MNYPIGPSDAATVSLVIPTRDRADSLARTLQAIDTLVVPVGLRMQVVVVLDDCTDGSETVLNKAQADSQHQIIKVQTGGLGAGGARNEGIQQASGKYIGFIDDDVIPDEDWLELHLACHQEQSEPVVSLGAMSLPKTFRLPAWNEWEVLSLGTRYEALSSGDEQAQSTDLYTANAMVPRDALIAVGGFDASLSRAEDVELADRLEKHGLKFIFIKEATVAHCPVRTLKSWKRIPVNYAISHLEMQSNAGKRDTETTGAPQLANMHRLTRWAVKLFSKRQLSSDLYCSLAQALGSIAHTVHLQKISYAAYSSIYNVLYFGTLHRAQEKSIGAASE